MASQVVAKVVVACLLVKLVSGSKVEEDLMQHWSGWTTRSCSVSVKTDAFFVLCVIEELRFCDTNQGIRKNSCNGCSNFLIWRRSSARKTKTGNFFKEVEVVLWSTPGNAAVEVSKMDMGTEALFFEVSLWAAFHYNCMSCTCLMEEKVTFLQYLKVFVVAEREYWMNWVCVLSWNGELDVSMFGGCWACHVFLYLITAFYSPVTTKLLNTVQYLILLSKMFKSDNFLRSSEELGLKGAVVSHAHAHFCSSAYKGGLVQKGPQNTHSSCCHTWS